MKISESMQIKGKSVLKAKGGGGLKIHKAIRKTVNTLIWQFNKVIH